MERRDKSCSELPAPLQCKMHGEAKGRADTAALGHSEDGGIRSLHYGSFALEFATQILLCFIIF